MANKLYLMVVFALVFALGVAHADTTLPADFRELVPMIEGAAVSNVKQTRDSITAWFNSRTAAEEVLSFYRRTLGEKGWHLLPDANADALKGTRQDQQRKIHFSLVCMGKEDRSTDFQIKLDFVRGRE